MILPPFSKKPQHQAPLKQEYQTPVFGVVTLDIPPPEKLYHWSPIGREDRLGYPNSETAERENELDQNVIDKMLHYWGQELRTHRNLAAHATGTKFTRIDAEDIFDFAKTICEYVFVLTRRFERFKARAKLRQPSKKKG